MPRDRHWAKKYQKLRSILPQARSLRAVDHDWEAVTSDRRRDLAVRKFFLGEIFSIDEEVREKSAARLVTHKQDMPGVSVIMAPETFHPGENDWVFSTDLADGRRFDFLLFYRKPIARDRIGRHIATISAQEKQALAAELQLILGNGQ